MEKKKFFNDLERVYQIIEQNQSDTNSLYDILDANSNHSESKFISDLIKSLGLEVTKETKMAVISRVVNLRSDSLKQVLEKNGSSEDDIEQKLELAYKTVSAFYIKKHQNIINQVVEKELLTPFYQEVFKGVHEVGLAFTSWQTKWTNHIIYGVNKDLYKLFNGDEEKIFIMLNQKNLHDTGHNNRQADRSYSALKKNSNGEYENLAYCDLFYDEVQIVVKALDKFIKNLKNRPDDIFNMQVEYIEYLSAIKVALLESDTTKLVEKWAEVDRKWMKITSPLQIGHPLEYYEDHYRKAVALEWDLRIVNPKNSAGIVIDDVKNMYDNIFAELKDVSRETIKTYNNSINSLNSVQLYLGRPALFYGAEFDGLFSAQVVPNDEVVSKEEGKKIFAFADNVLESSRAKPFLKLHSQIFPKDFLHDSRVQLFSDAKRWHEIYNITTIGHEYGHILWIDNDTETLMNKSGNFKNIEEFKATTGGLVAFFTNPQEELKKDIMTDVIKRAVGLISWRETSEVQPYYCEGLIHLQGLFETKVLIFEKELKIDMSDEAYEKLKDWYIQTYKDLATHYLLKKDASQFLEKFAVKNSKTYDPKDEGIRYFVNYYWNLYKEFGQVVDDKISKDDYIKV